MDSLLSAVILVAGITCVILFSVALIRGRRSSYGLGWLAAALLFALLTSAAHAIPDPLPEGSTLPAAVGRGSALLLAIILLLGFYGSLVISDLSRTATTRRSVRFWLLLIGLWLLAAAGSLLLATPPALGSTDWLPALLRTPDPGSLVLLVGIALTGALLLGSAFAAFYRASLAEVANRALYWIVASTLVYMAALLLTTGTLLTVILGMLLLLVAMVGATYAQTSYRVFDIRAAVVVLVRGGALVLLTALVLFVGLLVLNTNRIQTGDERTVFIIALALLLGLLYVPVRHITERALTLLLIGRTPNAIRATRDFSQQITTAVELQPLIEITTTMVNKVMGVRRSGLLLINDTNAPGGLELLVMPGGGFSNNMKGVTGTVIKDGPVYQRLAEERLSLLQFDVDYDPMFRAITPQERSFLRSLNMNAYTPIVVENVLIGLLACGPKSNDSPFYARDMELLETLGHQTGIALRNTRLVADLRHLNRTMQSLNTGLGEANEQLEKLDSVKTDFVTIASHELRTPLAQIRGYTDILDALNEQGMLEQDQVGGLVGNLRKATERMEELIAAMLDVSQLDVDAMDLRFTQTTLESVLRMAIDPITNEIKQRKLSLSMRGTRGLPPIQADMQRLVQAFRNVIQNAIKFTPDGGRIDIRASLREAKLPGETDQILVEVQDSGIGIAPENLELVFDKFFRAQDPSLHSTGAYKFMGAGPGLGLTIARGVIAGHGGKIWVESSGHDMKALPGSTFSILLPVSPPEDARRVMPFSSDDAPAAARTPADMRTN